MQRPAELALGALEVARFGLGEGLLVGLLGDSPQRLVDFDGTGDEASHHILGREPPDAHRSKELRCRHVEELNWFDELVCELRTKWLPQFRSDAVCRSPLEATVPRQSRIPSTSKARFELTPFDLDQLPVPPVDGMRRKATPDEHDAAETSKPSGGERDTPPHRAHQLSGVNASVTCVFLHTRVQVKKSFTRCISHIQTTRPLRFT